MWLLQIIPWKVYLNIYLGAHILYIDKNTTRGLYKPYCCCWQYKEELIFWLCLLLNQSNLYVSIVSCLSMPRLRSFTTLTISHSSQSTPRSLADFFYLLQSTSYCPWQRKLLVASDSGYIAIFLLATYQSIMLNECSRMVILYYFYTWLQIIEAFDCLLFMR